MIIIKFHGKTIWEPQYDCYIQISVITWYVKRDYTVVLLNYNSD